MNLMISSQNSLLNFTSEELTCYETWYKIIQHFSDKFPTELEPNNDHDIPEFGMITARFLKTSGIPKDILHDIWQIVDVENKGILEFSDFGNACRLVSFYQHEKILPNKKMLLKIPLKLAYFNISKFWEEIEKSAKADKEDVNGLVDSYFSDALHISDCLKIFKDLDENKSGFLDGITIFNKFIGSTLSQKELKQIWDYSDLDEDGKLSAAEFTIFNTLAKASMKRNININSGVSKRSMLILINKIIEIRSEPKKKDDGNIPKLRESNSSQFTPEKNEFEKLNSEIQRLSCEIEDFKLAKDVLIRYKDSDDQQIVKLSEKKLMLMAEHKDLIQNLNDKYSEIVKNRDLINYLYQDIKFLKETNNLLSNFDLPKVINIKNGKISQDTNIDKKIPKISKNTDVVLEKCQNRKYSDWVEFPSRDNPV
ncbi:protein with 2 Efh domains [Cryptosporidium sp. chipmunk genotype I]|uniref:protein with 2 Efh domains n=1 Tax=Cryptosporidium sp. chipmunk genotype I TaxID=1280935 RepID=UPI00351A458D|nr:protein with 2 Efh domains [Cryptosporidium sp. chipmunk genotype I]